MGGAGSERTLKVGFSQIRTAVHRPGRKCTGLIAEFTSDSSVMSLPVTWCSCCRAGSGVTDGEVCLSGTSAWTRLCCVRSVFVVLPAVLLGEHSVWNMSQFGPEESMIHETGLDGAGTPRPRDADNRVCLELVKAFRYDVSLPRVNGGTSFTSLPNQKHRSSQTS